MGKATEVDGEARRRASLSRGYEEEGRRAFSPLRFELFSSSRCSCYCHVTQRVLFVRLGVFGTLPLATGIYRYIVLSLGDSGISWNAPPRPEERRRLLGEDGGSVPSAGNRRRNNRGTAVLLGLQPYSLCAFLASSLAPSPYSCGARVTPAPEIYRFHWYAQ